jgi:hypothetical protein
MIFGPKRDDVTGDWRKLHNEELYDLYCSPNIIRGNKSRRMRWVGHVGSMGEGRGVYRVLVGKSGGKIPLGRPRRRWEDNIKMDVEEMGLRVEYFNVAHDMAMWQRLVNAVMNFQV